MDNEEREETIPLRQMGEPSHDVCSLLYPVKSVPSIHVMLLYAIQIALLTITGSVLIVHILCTNLCITDNEVFAELVATSSFVTGLGSVAQILLGIRLPLSQTTSWLYLAPVVSSKATKQCGVNSTSTTDVHMPDWTNKTEASVDEWNIRLQEVSGGIVVAAIVQCVLGVTGAVSIMMRFIGPLTIAPALCLLGLSLCANVINTASQQFGIAAMSLVLFILFSMVLSKVNLPFVWYNKEKGFHVVRCAAFKVFAMILSLSITWVLCLVLTQTNVLPDDPTQPGYNARTDAKLTVMERVGWFYIPYPGRWGLPRFTVSYCMSMTTVTLVSIMESVGAYRLTAKVCKAPEPPGYAINRGIITEGVVDVLCGMMGVGVGTTTVTATVGHIAYSEMASRSTWAMVGVITMLMGVFTKFGAALTLIPDPVIAGVALPSLGMITAISVSCAKDADLSSSRNLMVLGLSLVLGMGLPTWVNANPSRIQTGNAVADDLLVELLSNPMVLGFLIGFILDNIIPGTLEERGIQRQKTKGDCKNIYGDTDDESIYRLPCSSKDAI